METCGCGKRDARILFLSSLFMLSPKQDTDLDLPPALPIVNTAAIEAWHEWRTSGVTPSAKDTRSIIKALFNPTIMGSDGTGMEDIMTNDAA